MMKRRPQEFIARAEAAIDWAWRKLTIFESTRAAALLKLITVVDDRLRLSTLSGMRDKQVFSAALRFGQDALIYGIPWIFNACSSTNTPIPPILADADYKEGIDLAEYAEAYDSAVVGFTNYHQGRFRAFAARNDPRITFTYASREVESAELERKAYEMHALETEGEGISLNGPDALRSLLRLVATRYILEGQDRVRIQLDEHILGALRQARDWLLLTHLAQIDDSQNLAGFRYGSIRRYHAALAALCHGHYLLHLSTAVTNISGGAVSSLAFRMNLEELNSYVAQVSELDLAETPSISRLLTFDGSIPNMPSICQPLISANDTEVLVPFVYASGGRFERNCQKLLARHPVTSREYDRFSSSKENIALPRLQSVLRQRGILARTRVRITKEGRSLTDADLVAYDPRDGCLLTIQHKWLIEPDSVNESKACDTELLKAIEQARIAKTRLSEKDYARQTIPEIPHPGQRLTEGLVVSKGSEPTGYVSENDIPIVTEEWFIRNLPSSSGLASLYELAKSRPDRRQLATRWKPGKVTARLAGYELRIPGFRLVVEDS